MKIYFNEAFIETSRDTTNELWVKYNNGNKLDAYFKGLNIRDLKIKARIIIEWASGKRTNELLMLKSIDGSHFTFTMPILEEDGETKFTIKIYNDNVISHTAIFTRKIYETVEAADTTNITPAEYQVILDNIEKNRQKLIEHEAIINGLGDDKLDKDKNSSHVVYTNGADATPETVPYDAEKPTPNSFAKRDPKGHVKTEDPETDKDSANKCYVDILLAYNRVGLLAATDFDNDSGEIILIYNPDLVELITDVDDDTGEIALYPRPLRLEEGSNK